MSPTMSGVEQLRKRVDAARGDQTFAAIAKRMGESEQWLSNKMRGQRQWDVPELVRLAVALDADPVEWVNVRWPELASVDRLATLRTIIAGLSDEEIEDIEDVVRRYIKGQAATSRKPSAASRRTSTAGSRSTRPAAERSRPRSRSKAPRTE